MIAEMSRIYITGHVEQKQEIINHIIKMGVVHIEDIDINNQGEKYHAKKHVDRHKIYDLNDEIRITSDVISFLEKHDTSKKPMFAQKLTINHHDFADGFKTGVFDYVLKADEYIKKLNAYKSEKNSLQNTILSINPWLDYKATLALKNTNTCRVMLGTIPVAVLFEEKIDGIDVSHCDIEIIAKDKEQYYISALCHNDTAKELYTRLKMYGFNEVHFDVELTPTQYINQLEDEILHLEYKERNVLAKILQMMNKKDEFKSLYDHLCYKRSTFEITENFINMEHVFIIKGWIPSDATQKVKAELEKFIVEVEISAPEQDEDFPVFLQNNELVKPFEMITELYSTPNSKAVDPNTIMAPFYFMFFGMMLSDAGYGIVISSVSAFLIWKLKPDGIMEKLLKLMFLAGISTIIWGALFGSWFGDIFKGFLAPLWFNPLENPMKLLLWSFIFGGVHLFSGMALNAYKLIKRGKPWDALFDVGSWYILLIGVVISIIGVSTNLYLVYIGATMLVLTQGRHQKGIVKKLLTGVLSLYNITAYISDILSYSRLLALGLATGVIANVVNTMIKLPGFDSFFGVVIFIIGFVFGHTFNILINTLGAYVHASRLQYVEFYGKFFEGGGTPYKPFRINTKYIKIKE